MTIKARAKIMIGSVAVLGAAVFAGGAFTAGGLTNSAGATKFVGGTVAQSISGATLVSTAYGYTDASKVTVNSVTLTFNSGAVGKTVSIVLTPDGSTSRACTPGVDPGVDDNVFTCSGFTVNDVSNVAVTVA